MRYSNACIWKVENTLDEVKPLLTYNYSKYIRELRDLNIDDNEKKLINKWIPDGNDYTEKSITINNNELKYINATAYMEISDASDKLFLPNSNAPLPKDVRTSRMNSHVVFIKQTEFCYCIVKGSKSLEARLRNSLMKADRNSTLTWGKVNYKELPEFSLTKSFYYWILKNKGQTLTKDGKSINLNDVKGFKSNTDRETHSYNGEGSNIDNEIPLKSLVSTDEKLVSLYITLVYNNITYSFYLDYDGRLNICLPECGEHATQNPRPIAIDNLLLDIYFDIIPFLKAKHNEAVANGWEVQEIAYRKESAIQVIRELMAQNMVQKEEI